MPNSGYMLGAESNLIIDSFRDALASFDREAKRPREENVGVVAYGTSEPQTHTVAMYPAPIRQER